MQASAIATSNESLEKIHSLGLRGLPVDIEAAPDFIATLAERLRQEALARVEVAGILLGTRDRLRNAVTLRGIVPLECEHAFGEYFQCTQKDFESARLTVNWLNGAAGDLKPVGFFRTALAGAPGVREQDLKFRRELLRDPLDMVLLISHQASGAKEPSFHVWENGAMISASLDAFPFDKGIVPSDEPGPLAPDTTFRDDDAPRAAPRENPVPADRPASHRRLYLGSAAALCIVLLGSYSAWRWRTSASSSAPTREASAVATPAPATASLGLHVLKTDGILEVAWNRGAAVLSSQPTGKLEITDGNAMPMTIALDTEQLRIGKVQYFPASENLKVRLSVTPAKGEALSEGVLVTNPMSAAPLTQPEPPPPPVAVPSQIANNEPNSFVPPPSRKRDRLSPAQSPVQVPEPLALPQVSANIPSILTNGPGVNVPPPIDVQALPPPAPAGAAAIPKTPPKAQQTPTPAPAIREAVAIHKIMPKVPNEVRLRLIGTEEVHVKITVDPKGRVVNATALSKDHVGGALVRAATEAASAWLFQPAKLGDTPVPSETILIFRFSRSAGGGY